MNKRFSPFTVEKQSVPGKHLDKLALERTSSPEDLNEDFAYADPDRGLAIVADGVSIPPGGKIAAQTAVKAFAHIINQFPTPDSKDNKTIGIKLHEALQYAHERVREAANANPSADMLSRNGNARTYPGMATTLTAAWIVDRHLYFIHIGDCRLYIFRNRKVELLTKDQTLAAKLGLSGPDHKKGVAANSLSQAVGAAIPKPECKVYELMEDDLVLICSDGLTKVLERDDISKELSFGKDLQAKVSGLLSQAKLRGAKDDVTIILLTPPQLLSGTSTQISPEFKVSILKEMEFFRSLSQSEIHTFNGIGNTRTFQPREILMQEGTPASSFWIILKGEAEIIENGMPVETYGVGKCIGEGGLFIEEQMRMSTVRAKSELTALIINRDDWRKLAEQDSEIAAKVFEQTALILTKKLRQSHQKYVAKIGLSKNR